MSTLSYWVFRPFKKRPSTPVTSRQQFFPVYIRVIYTVMVKNIGTPALLSDNAPLLLQLQMLWYSHVYLFCLHWNNTKNLRKKRHICYHFTQHFKNGVDKIIVFLGRPVRCLLLSTPVVSFRTFQHFPSLSLKMAFQPCGLHVGLSFLTQMQSSQAKL